MNSAFVCIMGMGTVFIGLICIIALCLIMGLIFRGKANGAGESAHAKASSAPVAFDKSLSVQKKQEIIAGTCAVIAEELGTDVSNIRVLSFKKV